MVGLGYDVTGFVGLNRAVWMHLRLVPERKERKDLRRVAVSSLDSGWFTFGQDGVARYKKTTVRTRTNDRSGIWLFVVSETQIITS